MRKLLPFALCAVMLLFPLSFAGCKEKSERAHYVIEGEYFPAERKLTARMEVSVPNATENAFETVSFSLWANAYREGAKYSPVSELYAPSAYYAGMSYGGTEISSVEGAAGWEIAGEDENILRVRLEEPLYPGERTSLGISFTVTLANINHRLGVGRRTVNLTRFYPELCPYGEEGFVEHVYSCMGDPFVSECADFDVTLTLPADYGVAFGGVGETAADGEKQKVTAHAENVRDIAFVLGRQFSVCTDEAEGASIEYWYLSDERPEQTLKAAKDALSYFSRTFGAYAYPRYVLAETDLPYGGMEYSGLVMIAADLPREEAPFVVAHETAHQWWYGMVGSDQFGHAWQDEGLAEYSAALFAEAYPEYGGSYAASLARSEQGYRAFFSVQSQISKTADTSMDRPLTAFTGEYEYRNIAYDKGVILFDRVRSVVGERKFFSGLKNYVSDYSGKIASPQDLIACFQKSGGNAEALFRSFTEGACVI